MYQLLLFCLYLTAFGIDNGLGQLPQMGYNSWYDVFMNPSESIVIDTVSAMHTTGLYDAGYKYINLDDGIVIKRDTDGTLLPDPQFFPSGFKALADFIHSQGMLFGVYTDRGPKTCGGRPSAQGHEALDANTYAEWGIDYLKEDSCNANQDHQIAYKQYSLMRDALNATGRPIFFSLCGWNSWYAPVGPTIGNSWRIGPDDSNWVGILANIDDNVNLWPFAGPGGWNDVCLLLGRDYKGVAAVTDLQGRAQFMMWAIMAAPLLISSNVRNLTAYQLDTYLNKEVIAVNQDPLGKQGRRLWGNDLSCVQCSPRANIWGRPLSGGRWAIGFINVDTDMLFSGICDMSCLQITGWDAKQKLAVRDLWAKKDLPSTTASKGIWVTNLPLNGGSAMYILTPFF